MILGQVNGEFFTATYGFDCNLPIELLFVPMRLLPRQLFRFIENSISQRIFRPGHNDLYISLSEDRLTFTFCHEGDVHVGGSDGQLVAQVMSASPFAAFSWKRDGETYRSRQL